MPNTAAALRRTLPVLTLLLAGCGGGGMSVIGINGPAAQTLVDAGQTIILTTAVVNDPTHAGANFSVSGAGGTLGTPVTTRLASSDSIALPYTAPATVATTATATVTAVSVHTPSQTASVMLTLNPAIVATASLPAGTIAVTYSASAAATGGSGTLTYTLASGALPTGLTLSPTTGLISGKPTTPGTYAFTLAITDRATVPVTVNQSYSVLINAGPLVLSPLTLPVAVAGTFYSQQLAYTGGGTGTASYVLASGTLPAGLTLSTAGLISGTPTTVAAGATYTFSATVAVGTQTSAAQTYTLTVAAAPMVTTTSLPAGNVGVPYSQQLGSSGGSGGTPVFAVSAGSLPTGLTLSTSGLLAGTPTVTATSSFSVTVTVGTQTSVPQAFTLAVNNLIVTSSATATGEVGLPFSFQLTARGGTPPYTWSLASGSLPPGLSLNATTGVISGNPTTPATTSVTVQAKDSAASTVTQPLSITINAARTAVSNALLTGQYAFLLTGFDSTGRPTATAGKFTADGAGNILNGVLDTNGTASNATPAVALLPGTYAVGADGRGKLTLFTAAATTTYTFALDTVTAGVASSGTLVQFDGTGALRTGVLALQTALVAPTTGSFGFGLEGFAAGSTATVMAHRAAIGQLIVNTSAELLLSASSTATPTVATTTVLTPAVNGRATLALTLPNIAGTLNFALYPVSATRFFLLSLDHDLLSGVAQSQTGAFTNASLNATSVVHSQRITNGQPDLQLGLYTFNGSGTITQAFDENAAGVLTTNTIAGTYTVAANGRTTVTIAPAGLGGCANCTSLQTYFYLIAPNQGFVMDFSSGALSGAFDPQTATTPVNAGYSVGTTSPLSAVATQSTGTVTVAAGAFSGMVDQAAGLTLSPDTATSAVLTATGSGRLTTPQAVGYVASPTRILFLDRSAAPVLQILQAR